MAIDKFDGAGLSKSNCAICPRSLEPMPAARIIAANENDPVSEYLLAYVTLGIIIHIL
jgi:hypothetical protein